MQSLPSPADSPSLKPTDNTSQQASRKRQRSQSTQSGTPSSSAKRSLSEGPSNDDSLADNTITDIDAYMEEQGEADIPKTIQLSNPAVPEKTHTTMPGPIKLTTVKQSREAPMKVGDFWYIISRRWYKRWEKACTGEVDKEGGMEESDLGPVDNSHLLDKDGNITSSLLEGVDVEFVPEDVWALFVSWCVDRIIISVSQLIPAILASYRYGESDHPLRRAVIARGQFKEASIELRPPRLKALLLSKSDTTDITGSPHVYVTVSITDTVQHLCESLASAVSSQPFENARIWKIEGREFAGSIYPTGRLHLDGPEILKPSDQTLEDAMIEPEDAFVVEFKDDHGLFLIDLEKFPGKSISSSGTELEGPPPIFSSENDFFARMTQKSGAPAGSSKLASSSKSTPYTYKPSGFSSTATRNQTVTEPGTLGLGNM